MSDYNPPPGLPIPPNSANPQTVALIAESPEIQAIDRVMGTLQDIHPRIVWQAQAHGDPSQPAFIPCIDPVGWVRGRATSPGGAPLADPRAGDTISSGSYFIGAPEVFLQSPPPQRVVWEPPGEGEESAGPEDAAGPLIDGTPQPESGGPVSPWPWVPGMGQLTPSHPAYTQMGGQVVPSVFMTWLMPWRAHVWGLDYGDTRQLVSCLQAAIYTVFAGTTGQNNVWQTPTGGWATDEKASMGLHYVLNVNFVIAIVTWQGQNSVRAIGLTTSESELLPAGTGNPPGRLP